MGREPLSSGSEYEDIKGSVSRSDISREELRRAFEEMRERIQVQVQCAQDKFRLQYDKKARPLRFEEGERAWKYNRGLSSAADHVAQKLNPKYVPVRIVRHVGRDTYEIVTENEGRGVQKVHANDLYKDQ